MSKKNNIRACEFILKICNGNMSCCERSVYVFKCTECAFKRSYCSKCLNHYYHHAIVCKMIDCKKPMQLIHYNKT